MTFVDSSVWIDYFRGTDTAQTDFLDQVLDQEELVIGDIILTEVLQGFDREQDFETARELLTGLTIIEVGGYSIALQAARNFRFLRSRGITVRKTIDTLIATRCIMDNLRLLHNDRDFDPFVALLGLTSVIG